MGLKAYCEIRVDCCAWMTIENEQTTASDKMYFMFLMVYLVIIKYPVCLKSIDGILTM
jgi:hypothetical protein